MATDVALVPLLRAAKAVTGVPDPDDEVAHKEVAGELVSQVNSVLPEVREFSQLPYPVRPPEFKLRTRVGWVIHTVAVLSDPVANPHFRLRLVDRRPNPRVSDQVLRDSEEIGRELGRIAKTITAEADVITGEVMVFSENLVVGGGSRLTADEAPIFDRVARHVATHLLQRGIPWLGEELTGRPVSWRRPAVSAVLEGHANLVGNGSAGTPFQTMAKLAASRMRPETLLTIHPVEPLADRDGRGLYFVASVAERRGIDGLNAMWRRPADLPRPNADPNEDELLNPKSWERRVLGEDRKPWLRRRRIGRG